MQGIIRGSSMLSIFGQHLREGKIYLFQNIHVIPADAKYRIAPHQFQLSFENDTKIVKILDDCATIPRFKFSLVKLIHIEQPMDNDLHLIGTSSQLISFLL